MLEQEKFYESAALEYDLEKMMFQKMLPIRIRSLIQQLYPVFNKLEIQQAIEEHFEHERLEKFCELHGHDMVDESYGGPESGCMAGYCKRCGYSFHHILY